MNTFAGRDWTKSVDDNWPRFLRPAYRFRYNITSRYEFVGLRVARSLDRR